MSPLILQFLSEAFFTIKKNKELWGVKLK